MCETISKREFVEIGRSLGAPGFRLTTLKCCRVCLNFAPLVDSHAIVGWKCSRHGIVFDAADRGAVTACDYVCDDFVPGA